MSISIGSLHKAARRATAAGAFAMALAVLTGPTLSGPAFAQPAAPQPPAGGSDTLTPPPVLDPKAVETKPITPGAGKAFSAEELTLQPVPVLVVPGNATWDEAYDKLVASVKAARAELARLGLQAAGDVFIVYTSSDDLGFDYEVQLPFSGTTTSKPQGGAKLGGSHAGKLLKFRHSGAFSDMDGTYEQIANYLDEKNINSEELYIEQYRSDILTTPADKLEIDILVPLP